MIHLEINQHSQLANRLVYSMEQLDDYSSDQKVLVVGRPHSGNYPFADEKMHQICKGTIIHYTIIFGAPDQISEGWIRVFNNYVGTNYTKVTNEELESIKSSDAVQQMGIYPAKDSIMKINDVVVIKLSD